MANTRKGKVRSLDGIPGASPAVKLYLPDDVLDRFYAEARSRGMTLSALGRDILIMRYASAAEPADQIGQDYPGYKGPGDDQHKGDRRH